MSSVTRRQRTAANQESQRKNTKVQKDAETNPRTEVKGHPMSKVNKEVKGHLMSKVSNEEPRLPWIEMAFYVVCIVVIMVKANILAVYKESQDHMKNFGVYNLKPGWRILGGRLQDVSDFEWSYSKETHFSPSFLAVLFGHVIIGRVSDAYAPKMKIISSLVYSIACILGFVGWKVTLIFLLHTAVTFIASRTRRSAIVWAVMILQIATLNFDPFLTYQRLLFDDERDFHNVIFGVAMCQLRLLSFGIDYCQNGYKKTKKTDREDKTDEETDNRTKETEREDMVTKTEREDRTDEQTDKDKRTKKTDTDMWSFYHILVYNFWLPVFAGGPVVTYDVFRSQYYQDPKPLTKVDVKQILKEFLRYALWWLVIDVSLHFLYFPAFQQRKHLLTGLPSWAIGGIALNCLIFFQLKYMVLYGMPRAIGLFDRVQVPLPPICVLGTYMFQDFWRYFDRGLHRLLVKSIYIPLGGSRRGLILQMLSSMLCFVFVYYWHGSDTHLLYWSWFNWLGVTFEQLIEETIAKRGWEKYWRGRLSGAMYRRLIGLLRTPFYICLAASNLVFLAGTGVAHVYFDRLILSGWPYEALTTAFLLYCFIQVVMEFHRAYGKKYMCEKKYAL